jgi:hypothetical protein
MSFSVEREVSIEKNVDPTGRKWNVVHLKGSALYEARPEPYRSDIVTPDEFEGRWTKPEMLLKQIRLYLNRAWDASDKAAEKAARQQQAAIEAAAMAKAEAKAEAALAEATAAKKKSKAKPKAE